MALSNFETGLRKDETVEAARGPVLAGVVLVLDERLGMGYVQETSTGRRFGISRDLMPQSTWEALSQGRAVRFRDSGRNIAVALTLDE
jgi:hypothetical protein